MSEETLEQPLTGRRSVPRSMLSLQSTLDRDPVEILQDQATRRVASLVPIRYARMLTSPFAFFRGAAAVQAADLASGPHTGLEVQLCGDAHLSNFGLFATPERRLAFDLNDFDETVRGPFEWDVKRFVASVDIAASTNGYSRKARVRTLLDAAAAYRAALGEFARMSHLDLWYAHLSADALLELPETSAPTRTERQARRIIAKAMTRDHLQAFSKLVVEAEGTLRFASAPPLLVRLDDLVEGEDRQRMLALLNDVYESYLASLTPDRRVLLSRYRAVDVAHKVVGVGSVGTQAYVVLFVGRDERDPLLLQVKEAQSSVFERHLPGPPHPHAGERVVNGQRLIQAYSDIFLGWTEVDDDGRHAEFIVRQLRDWKGSIELEDMTVHAFRLYANLCAWTLARAHARSGNVEALASYVGVSDRFDRAMADYAQGYAEQNERDFAALRSAADSGPVQVAHEGF